MSLHLHVPTRSASRALAFLCAATLLHASAAAQSLLERTPNLSGGWVGAPNSVQFAFLHRFNNSGAPQRQIVNRPTFLLGYTPSMPLLVGVHYATRSEVADRYPNEWEAFARYRILGQGSAPLDVAVQVGYNLAAESVDGELSAATRIGPVRLLGAARALQSGYGEDSRFAFGAGAVLRLTNSLAIAADIASLLDADSTEEAAWGVGIQIGIPLTPHTLSLQATNTNTATMQGASRGSDATRWGFEFTVPIALGRYFGPRVAPPVVDPATPPMAEDAAIRAVLADSISRALRREYQLRWQQDSLRIALRGDSMRLAQQLDSIRRAAVADSLRNAQAELERRAAQDSARRAEERAGRSRFSAGMRNLAYEPARIEIVAGTTVVWRNNDQVEHTVTASDRSWDSGIIRPGATWERTFTRPGTYEFYCTPHPFMKGIVIVRPAS